MTESSKLSVSLEGFLLGVLCCAILFFSASRRACTHLSTLYRGNYGINEVLYARGFYMNGKNVGTGTSNSEDTLTSLTSEGLAKKLIEQYVQVNSSVFELPQRESVVSNLACANPEILSLSIVTPLESSIVTKDYAMLQVSASGKALAPLDQTNFYTVGSGKELPQSRVRKSG